MTLWASRDGQNVEVRCTYGPVEFSVKEDSMHLRHFWDQLGKVLNEAEAEAELKADRIPAPDGA